jgi:lysyl endopeptidase
MRFRILASLLLTAFGSVAALSASAQEMFAEPVTESALSKALGASAFLGRNAASSFVTLDRVDADLAKSLRGKRAAAKKDGQPLQIGIARDVAPGLARLNARELNWESVEGGMVAKFTIASSGAEALRAAFIPNLNLTSHAGHIEVLNAVETMERTLDRVTLRFAGSDEGKVFTLDGSSIVAGELTWSPVVNGDTMTVEIHLADGVSPGDLSLSVPQVSHLDIHPLASSKAIRAKIGESDSCENDILCRSGAPSGFMNTSNAVARMVFTKSGSSYLCTGTLLNNTNSPRKHMFYTANHCISSSTVANTLQTYWFYHASTCNGSTVNSGARTLTGGAFLRYNNASRDVTLLELKNTPPSGAIYAGWNAATLSNVAIEGIHHPAGDVKKYSLGNKIGNESLDGMGPFHKVRWNDGVTEGGSSGSGLFTVTAAGAYQLRGGLYGGYSFCSAPSDPDYYSRLSDVYTSLQPYLMP